MELNEETLEQILARQREEYQRYLGILAEDFKSQVKLVAEFQGGLAEDVRVIRDQLMDLQERVTRIEGYVAAIRDMAAKNTQDIVVIRVDIETIKADIAIIRRDLKDKAARDELAVLETRVAELERTLRSR